MELNSLFFLNVGRIMGSSSSALDRADLVQFGIKGLLYSEDKFKVDLNASFFYGQLEQDSDSAGNDLWGGIFHIAAATDREGLNGIVRLSLPSIQTGELGDYLESQYDEIVLGGGLSYRFVSDILDIEPYVGAQLPLDTGGKSGFVEGYYKEFDTYEGDAQVSELGTGIHFAFHIFKDLRVSLEPYFISRIWEEEIGANLTLVSNKCGIYLGGGTTNSDYEFCPDRDRINLGCYSELGEWGFRAQYELVSEDYGKVTDNHRALFSVIKRF
jgi:hypothetical protein